MENLSNQLITKDENKELAAISPWEKNVTNNTLNDICDPPHSFPKNLSLQPLKVIRS